MMFKVIIQKPIVGKSRPSEQDRRAARRVLVVEAADRDQVVARILDTDMSTQPLAGTTGEILGIEPVDSWFVVLAP